jgi:hypothetical protein
MDGRITMLDLRRARTRRLTGALLATAALTMAATATATPASAAEFNCDASALRGTVLSAASIEPVTANRGQAACLAADNGVGVSLPPALSASAVFARTAAQGAADQRIASSTGGVADLHVHSVALAALDNVGNVTLPGGSSVDLRPALRALQARTELLGATTAVASAGGRCSSGNPLLSGSSQLLGLTVLGQQVSADTASLNVTLDPSDLTDADIAVLGLPAIDVPLIRAFVNAAQDITVAQIDATIGGQTNVNGKLTRQAARVHVTSAGENVADLVLGEATTTGAGVDCAAAVDPTVAVPPIAAPPIAAPFVGLTAEQQREQLELQRGQAVSAATLRCTTRRLVLVDVLRQGNRVKLLGVADKRYIGQRVGIVFTATGRTVAHATVLRDGTFATTAALPPRAIRNTNRARYQAVRGGERSLRLKLARRMVVSSVTSRNGRVTIAGHITRPLGKPIQAITLQRRVSCTRYVAVKRFTPSRTGRFQVTASAPKGQTTAVYRLSTRVPKTTSNAKLYPTFTLPRAVSVR